MEQHTLYELNEYIRRILALNLPAPVWVSCEIYQHSESRGHHFFSLVEKGAQEGTIIAQSEAVIWKRAYQKLSKRIGKDLDLLLAEGTQVLLKVQTDFNERYGLKLLIEDIDLSYTLGQIEQQRRATLQRLQSEGLLELNPACPLPAAPKRLAVISSESAAGLEDFRRQLDQNEYGYCFQYRVFSATMQGDRAPAEIARQIQAIQNLTRPYDCIIIIRGGGARLDLAAFDQYDLCAVAARCPIPILTGIGHEIDEVLLDRVAHTALKTPTAVANFIIDRAAQLERQLAELGHRLLQLAQQRFQSEGLRLQGYAKSLELLAQQQIRQAQQQLGQLQQQIPAITRHHLQLETQRLSQYNELIQLLSPASTLARGYSITTQNGKRASAQALRPGDTITTRLSDGDVKSTVQ